MLNFSISFKPGIPIYEQIVYAVKKAVVSGQLKAGDPFPSVREISKELKINPNTAQKVVSHLVQARLLDIRPGIGSVVSEKTESSAKEKEQILRADIEHLVVEAKRLSIKKKELMDAITRHWELDF